ncbi:hypothetical protein VPH5P1C_0150 [Vibrio phage 5P1c]
MDFLDYTVKIAFTNFLGKPEFNTFDVMAYSEEEAQEIAFKEFSSIHGDNYQKVNSFDVVVCGEEEE